MRYLITGGSGYIGTRLVELLSRREDTEKIVICDVVPPKGGYQPKTEFERVDVRDRGAVHSALQRAKPDVLVHLAFILNPSHDEGFMYDVDVNGTHNVLEAAGEAGIRAGARDDLRGGLRRVPGQPGPDHRGAPGARGGALLVRARQDGVRPDRPALGAPAPRHASRRSCGPASCSGRTWTTTWCGCGRSSRSRSTPATSTASIQFVHEDDVVEAVSGLLLGRHAGQFNLAPRRADDAARVRRAARHADPQDAAVASTARLGEAALAPAPLRGAARPDRLRALPVDRVEREAQGDARLDPEAHSTRETFEITMRAHGKLPRGRRARGVPRPPRTQSYTRRLSRAVSSAGRAPARQAGGHWFEPSTAHSCAS